MDYFEREKLKERLRKEKNLGFITTFKDCGKEYVKTIKAESFSKFEYIYFELKDGKIQEIKDEQVVNRLKKLQEIEDERVY